MVICLLPQAVPAPVPPSFSPSTSSSSPAVSSPLLFCLLHGSCSSPQPPSSPQCPVTRAKPGPRHGAFPLWHTLWVCANPSLNPKNLHWAGISPRLPSTHAFPAMLMPSAHGGTKGLTGGRVSEGTRSTSEHTGPRVVCSRECRQLPATAKVHGRRLRTWLAGPRLPLLQQPQKYVNEKLGPLFMRLHDSFFIWGMRTNENMKYFSDDKVSTQKAHSLEAMCMCTGATWDQAWTLVQAPRKGEGCGAKSHGKAVVGEQQGSC